MGIQSNRRGGGGAGFLLDKLYFQKVAAPFLPGPNEISDVFTTVLGTQINMTTGGGESGISGSNLTGSIERNQGTSGRLNRIDGAAIMRVQALSPDSSGVTSNTINFPGNIASYIQVGKKIIGAQQFTSDGQLRYRHIRYGSGQVARFTVLTSTYNAGTDTTVVTVSNPNGLDLSLGISAINQPAQLRFFPWDYKFQVKGAAAGTYQDVEIADANIYSTGILGIPGIPAGAFSTLPSLTGSVVRIYGSMSPNGTYGVVGVRENTSGSLANQHFYYTKNGGSSWTHFSTVYDVAVGGEYAYYYWPVNDQIAVADNGKMFALYVDYSTSPNYSYHVKGCYSDLSVGSPALTDSAATGVDSVNQEGTAGFLFATTSGNKKGFLSADLTDLSYIAIAGLNQDSTVNMRWFTNGGATYLNSDLSGYTQIYQNNVGLAVTGTGIAHRTFLFNYVSTSDLSYKYWDQPSATPLANTTITSSNFQIFDTKLAGSKVYLLGRNGSGNPVYISGTTTGTPAFSGVKSLNGSLDMDQYGGKPDETVYSGVPTFAQKGNGGRIIADPASNNHLFFIGDFLHPDGCYRASMFEVADDTAFQGIQTSNYAAGSAAELRNASTTERMSQSFTSGTGQRLRSVALKCYQNGTIASGTQLTVTLQTASAGIPTGVVVANAINTYDPSLITKSTSGEWLSFYFAGLTLNNTQEYAIVIDANYAINASNRLTFLASSGNVFAGDQRLYNGSAWIDNTATDLNLEINSEWQINLGNALPASLTFEDRNRNNFESSIVLKNSAMFNFITRRTKNPRFGTETDSYPKTGHAYKREIIINSPGTIATIGSITQTGFLSGKLDENLVLNVSFGNTDNAVIDVNTGVVSSTLQGEDRAGWNIQTNAYTSATFVNEPLFDSGRAFEGNGSSSRVGYQAGGGDSTPLFWLLKQGNSFAIEVEFTLTTLTSTKGILNCLCGNYLNGSGSDPGWAFYIDATDKLYFFPGIGGSASTVGQTSFTTGIHYKVRVTGDGNTIRLYVNTGSGWTEETYSSQLTGGYNLSQPTQITEIGNFPNQNVYNLTGRIGYVKIANGSSTFAYEGYSSQPPLCDLFNLGSFTLAKPYRGQNTTAQDGNFKTGIVISASSQSALVDSYDQILQFGSPMSSIGNDLWFKLDLGRGTSLDASKVLGYLMRYSRI